MPVDHYENFPVASWVLPRALRRPVEVIYAFARSADDFADEGDRPAAERLAALDGYRRELGRIEAGEPPHTELFRELAAVVAAHRLPLAPFRDLLDAFTQDVTCTRYADFAEVLDYCRRSANPVGRLLLHLYGCAHPQALARSDRICSALQLVNFLQDVARDWAIGRVYLAQDELRAAGIDETQIAQGRVDERWTGFMHAQAQRAIGMLEEGAPLARTLPGRAGLELRLVVAGGLRIARRVQAVGGDVFRTRPVLGWRDWLAMAGCAAWYRFPAQSAR
jgi:phytoene synthase